MFCSKLRPLRDLRCMLTLQTGPKMRIRSLRLRPSPTFPLRPSLRPIAFSDLQRRCAPPPEHNALCIRVARLFLRVPFSGSEKRPPKGSQPFWHPNLEPKPQGLRKSRLERGRAKWKVGSGASLGPKEAQQFERIGTWPNSRQRSGWPLPAPT